MLSLHEQAGMADSWFTMRIHHNNLTQTKI